MGIDEHAQVSKESERCNRQVTDKPSSVNIRGSVSPSKIVGRWAEEVRSVTGKMPDVRRG